MPSQTRRLACIALLAFGACHRAPAHQGVLLGLASGRTLFLAWPNDSARLVTEKPHLIVPREDGLWWVGTVGRCTVGSTVNEWVEDTVFLYREEAVFVTRAGEDARVKLDGTTCDVAGREVLMQRARGQPDTSSVDWSKVPADSLPLQGLYCGIDARRITFASPTVLSVEERYSSTEYCNPAKYSTSGYNIVTRFGSTERIPVRPLLAPEVRAKLESIFATGEGCAYESENPGGTVDSSWSIRRQRGAWAAYIWMDGPIVCRGGQDVEEGELLPHSFTGDSPLPPPVIELIKQDGMGYDAVTSPSGAYVIIQKRDSLLLFHGNDAKLDVPMVRVHIGYGEELAMVRWTTPDETRRLTRSLPTMQPPTIHVEPTGRRELP